MIGEAGVLQAMEAAGVPVPEGIRADNKYHRYGRQKKAFYKIHEWSGENGRRYYVGVFGYKGDVFKLAPVAVSDYVMSDAERQAWAKKQAALEQAEAARAVERAHRAAGRARSQWAGAEKTGASAYLAAKGVAPEGCRFMTAPGWEGWLIVPLLDYASEPGKLVGSQKISPTGEKRFNQGMAKDGAALRLGEVVDGQPIWIAEGYATALTLRMALEQSHPVFMACDANNLLPVAQRLRQRFPDCPLYFAADDDYLTGEPGRLKADAAAQAVGNARVLLPRFGVARRASKDDDSLPKLTDFNDLHTAEGLGAVQAQLHAALAGQPAPAEDSPAPAVEAPAAAAEEASPDGAGAALDYLMRHVALIDGKTRVWDVLKKVEMSLSALRLEHGKDAVAAWSAMQGKRKVSDADVRRLKQRARIEDGSAGEAVKSRYAEVLERYVFLDGTDNVFDLEIDTVISQSAFKAAIGGELFSEWSVDPARLLVWFKNVIFDPTQKRETRFDGQPCDRVLNTFRGLTVTPRANDQAMSLIFDLLEHLCNGDAELVHWLTCWLAYPLQHVGAKMATAVLMHGRVHGSGKSLLFDGLVKPIYGEYGATLGQHQLESQYTDWRSKKLFCLFEEVLSSGQRYSHTGTIKHMITGATQRIEQKFVSGWEEANHMNAVFLSNELQPFHIEEHDRRMLVIWPKNALDIGLQKQLQQVIASGAAVEAFYHYLLNYPLGEFGPHTKPLMTAEKMRIIDYGRNSLDAFWKDWSTMEESGERNLFGFPFGACVTEELYSIYEQWCAAMREKNPKKVNIFVIDLSTRMLKVRRRYRISKNVKQAMMFIPHGMFVPEGAIEADWLGQMVSDFRSAAREAGFDCKAWDKPA